MNTLGYIVRRLARTFGYKNQQERLVTARREGQLLNEAEYILGQMAWREAEHIEELGDEYWKIVDIDEQLSKLQTEIREVQRENGRLARLHEELERKIESDIARLTAEKTGKTSEAITLMHQAEGCRDTAEATRKKFEGLKTKYKVLSGQGTTPPEDLQAITATMRELKNVYNADKQRLAEIAARIREAEKAAADVERRIAAFRDDSRREVAALTSELGKSSNLVAQHSARIGALERTRRDLAAAVGVFLTQHSKSTNPAIREAVRKHRGLIAKINTLEQSINYNRILSGRMD